MEKNMEKENSKKIIYYKKNNNSSSNNKFEKKVLDLVNNKLIKKEECDDQKIHDFFVINQLIKISKKYGINKIRVGFLDIFYSREYAIEPKKDNLGFETRTKVSKFISFNEKEQNTIRDSLFAIYISFKNRVDGIKDFDPSNHNWFIIAFKNKRDPDNKEVFIYSRTDGFCIMS